MTRRGDRRPGDREADELHLLRSKERVAAIDRLAARFGGRVGLEAVLADLDRTARATRVRGHAVVWAFRWDREDRWTRRWYPQGITSSADRDRSEEVAGRRVLCTSWYAKGADGRNEGSRVSFVDLTDPGRLRYRHVLLVEPVVDRDTGRIDVRPVRIHAGGLVWHGPFLHAAATARGICVFRLDDIVRGDAFGHRYLLPLRFRYDAVGGDGTEPLRYSFLSLDRSATPAEVVAGEYGRRSMSTRLARYHVDPQTSLLRTDEQGRSRPVALELGELESMQGAVSVDGTYYVSVSAGRLRRGSVYVGRPGAFRRHRGVLPVGPEDLSYWPSTDQLWSLTEYPGRRAVLALDRARLT